MRLWIRSQDRETLIQIKIVEIEFFGEVASINTRFDEKNTSLGIYKPKERALEVLDEIQKYILLPNTDNSAYVYEMPEE